MLRSCLLVAVLSGVAFADPPATADEHAELTIRPTAKPFNHITIENPLGDVRVEGHDAGTLRIEAFKHAPDTAALDRLHLQLVPNPDGSVRLKASADPSRDKEAKPVPRSAVRVDLVIHAPRNVRVEASASAGKLEIANMDAGGDLDTASGLISVRNVSGELSTHSLTGPTSIAQVFGSIDAQTITADMDLDSINGERLIATVSHGKIAGRRIRSRHVELTSSDGMIVLEAEAALQGHLIVATTKGDIDVRIRRHGALVVHARGPNVNLGPQQKVLRDGVLEAQFGEIQNSAAPALVEMRSQLGTVKFGLLE